MAHFVGLDVSVKETSVCVVDDAGKVILEQKVPTEPSDIIALLTSLGVTYGRIGIEAGPLSQWLFNALKAAELPVICVETRHMKALLMAQQVNKTDRNDARGIAQMMRVGLFKPVHVKTLVAQEQRMLLTSRKLLQRKLLDLESDLRGTLRNFGLKVGTVSGSRYEARVRELVAGFPRLAAIAEPLLNVRRAIVAVARRLAVVLHRMWVDGSEFRWSKDSAAAPQVSNDHVAQDPRDIDVTQARRPAVVRLNEIAGNPIGQDRVIRRLVIKR